MSSNDYFEEVKVANPGMFGTTQINIKSAELERIIKLAFEIGYDAGTFDCENDKSIFEKIFG